MVNKLPIIREIFKGDHNAVAGVAAVRKLTRKQISALFRDAYLSILFDQHKGINYSANISS